MQTVIAIAMTASLGGAATLASPSLIGESQSVACQHELTILQQAIDVYPVVSAEMEPPTPRGMYMTTSTMTSPKIIMRYW